VPVIALLIQLHTSSRNLFR